jgi:hypothetical protein
MTPPGRPHASREGRPAGQVPAALEWRKRQTEDPGRLIRPDRYRPSRSPRRRTRVSPSQRPAVTGHPGNPRPPVPPQPPPPAAAPATGQTSQDHRRTHLYLIDTCLSRLPVGEVAAVGAQLGQSRRRRDVRRRAGDRSLRLVRSCTMTGPDRSKNVDRQRAVTVRVTIFDARPNISGPMARPNISGLLDGCR